ncbi:hypothetical protein [Chitinivorax sp. B]|uniref:hypothetical protein n=1 Tax=Chitinivorax sp. B TaxID=2502235 RepID=UPI0010F710BF|nr:hypothetical protein [Chitinivorax sp. B]
MWKSLTVISASLLASGCATYSNQVSFIHGERYHRAAMHTYLTHLVSIDGEAAMLNQNPVPIEPGHHVLKLVTAPAAGFRVPETRLLKLKVEPCKRYYIVARKTSSLAQDWTPQIDEVESRPECKDKPS